ncbi:hypothetical protein GJ699_27385 [Duganella sp. FT80W]|uniref:DUF1640 domain-containing protein n=1 Tax=Duganella guangzhouensis TaxID=2666084 RepID=A0A6I2LA75_9BURK|nr:hypothetical protein [Duganella guangzhouensis]MRW93724.1 hypothetical protein [Duganella guangzhouensis]
MELQELEKYFATKVDLMAFREDVATQFGKVYAEIAHVHVEIARLEIKVAQLETRIIKWFVATAMVLVGAAFAAGRYLP